MPNRAELEQQLAEAESRISAVLASAKLRAKTPTEHAEFLAAGNEIDRIEQELQAMGEEPDAGSGTDSGDYLASYQKARADLIAGKGLTRESMRANMRAQLERDGVLSPSAVGAVPSPQGDMRRQLGQPG